MTPQTSHEMGFRSYTPLVQGHSHPFVQIVLPLRGVLEMEIAGRGGRVDGGCAAVIGAGEPRECGVTPTAYRRAHLSHAVDLAAGDVWLRFGQLEPARRLSARRGWRLDRN